MRVPLLSVTNLSVRYASGRSTHAVLDAVSFALDAHEIVGVCGPCGSGKTTLALALGGMLPSDATVSGTVCFSGRDLSTLSEHERQALRGAEIGIVFQESARTLNPVLAVGAQVSNVVRAHTGCDRAEARERSLAAMRDVGLTDDTQRMFDAYPHELSGGQRQRILIALAIVCRPALVVADEPTASLDAKLRDEILRMIRRLNDQHGTAFLVISHSADLIERTARRTIVMDRGRVVNTDAGGDNAARPAGRVARSLSRSVSASRHAPCAELTGGTKTYRIRLTSSSYHDVQALRGVDLRVERGSTLGLTGPSGCGKSTLARCLAGLEPLDAGTVRIDGRETAPPFGNQVQLVAQDAATALTSRRPALEIVTASMNIRDLTTPAERRRRAVDLLSQVGLSPTCANALAGELSFGERQRLVIARALAVRPRLLILDEAFSGLDVETRSQITSLLMTLQREHELALLCVSLDFEFLAEFAPEIAVMYRGVIVEQGTMVRRYIPEGEVA